MGWILTLALSCTQATSSELVPSELRAPWRQLAGEAARAGAREVVGELGSLLTRLGESPEALRRLDQGWQRSLAGARPDPRAAARLAQRIEHELPALVAALDATTGEARLELARCVLTLAEDEPAASAVLGREAGADGVFRSAEEQADEDGATRLATLEREASALDFELVRGPATNPTLVALGGGTRLGVGGLELSSALSGESLARSVTRALQAAAFGRALYSGEFTPRPPKAPRRYLVLRDDEEFEAALRDACTAGRMEPEVADEVRRLTLQSFSDPRGWTTLRWRPEADLAATLLWDLSADWLPANTQPCLRTGHVNALSLRFLGAPIPRLATLDAGSSDDANERSRASAQPGSRDLVLRAAQRNFLGTRSWMLQKVRAGEDPPWARAMLDQEGKISGEVLLKTTLVCEFLHVEGGLRALCEATRGASQVPAAMEKALGTTLPEFESRWRRWLDPGRPQGLLRRLREPRANEGEPDFDALRLALDRARTDANAAVRLEAPRTAFDPDLSLGAALHARYLALNPEQRTWPGMHEEHAGRPGFSPAGALAASRSLVATDATPEQALGQWLASYYHRLPLLDPGLIGVGVGHVQGVVVMDVHSLVVEPWQDVVTLWPADGALGVPRAFQPELPSPAPGRDLASLGYPITVQLAFATERRDVTLALELWQGTPEQGESVAGLVLTPASPHAPGLAAENAWGFLPERHLAPRTRYTAVARWLGNERRWSFTTGP